MRKYITKNQNTAQFPLVYLVKSLVDQAFDMFSGCATSDTFANCLVCDQIFDPLLRSKSRPCFQLDTRVEIGPN